MADTSKNRGAAFALAALAGLAAAVSGAQSPSAKELIAKNIEAAGGRAKIEAVRTLSFKAGSSDYFVSAKGEMKVISRGRDSAVAEIILVDSAGGVRKKAKDAESEVTGPEAAVSRALAGVLSGVFSLVRFEGKLEFLGLKSSGPEKLYDLRAKDKDTGLAVDFFLRPDDYRLKRLLFQGVTAEGDVFKVNYDFGPFEGAEGLTMPTSWFGSRVGARGNLAEVSEVKVNPPLAADFFSTF